MESLRCDKNFSHIASKQVALDRKWYLRWGEKLDQALLRASIVVSGTGGKPSPSMSLVLYVFNSSVYRKVPGWRRLHQGLSQLFLCRDLNFHVTLAAHFWKWELLPSAMGWRPQWPLLSGRVEILWRKWDTELTSFLCLQEVIVGRIFSSA